MYATSDGSGHFTAGHVTATGIPAPTLSLPNPPSWLGLGNQVITYPGSGAPTTSALLKDLARSPTASTRCRSRRPTA